MKQTVLSTGTSSGLGKTAARLLARSGWNVVATMRRPEAEKELANLDNGLVSRLDVQDGASITEAIEAGIARFGQIDALINNAGFGLYGLFEATPREKVQEQFDVNVFGVMDVTRALLPHFRNNKGGLIINVSSGAGVFTLPMLSLYCATKFALEGFSEALSYELASQNILVKIVEPGGVLSTNFEKRSGDEAMHNLVLAGPLFQGGQLRAQYRASKAKFDEVKAAYEQSALTALQEVSNALIARQKLGEIRFYDEQAAVALTSSVDLATQRYLNGRSSYYEVLQAQQELYPTQRAQVQAQVGEWIAVVQLYKALGAGWKTSPVENASK